MNGPSMPDPACARPEERRTCITCGDVAIAATVVRVLHELRAIVAIDAALEEIDVSLVAVRPGDTVLVHAGVAIGVVAP